MFCEHLPAEIARDKIDAFGKIAALQTGELHGCLEDSGKRCGDGRGVGMEEVWGWERCGDGRGVGMGEVWAWERCGDGKGVGIEEVWE